MNLVQLSETVELAGNLHEQIRGGVFPNNTARQFPGIAKCINEVLFGVEKLEIQSASVDDCDAWLNDIEKLLPIWRESIINRKKGSLERQFYRLYEYFKYVRKEDIIEEAISALNTQPADRKSLYTSLPKRYTFLTGKIDVEQGDYSLISIYTDMIKNEVENFKWLFFKLADNRSKAILLRVVKYWFSFDLNNLLDLHENVFRDYYDLDLVQAGEDDVLVDCGAFDGDSIISFIGTYVNYKKIYGYEISPNTWTLLNKKLDGFENIVLRNCGVGSKKARISISSDDGTAGTKLDSNGSGPLVNVVTLDEDIEEKISIIKMDIEGAEQDALLGAKNHILNDKPKLLICTYHKPDDIFQIPRLIDSIRDDYKFYFRYNGRGSIWPCDYVLFAI